MQVFKSIDKDDGGTISLQELSESLQQSAAMRDGSNSSTINNMMVQSHCKSHCRRHERMIVVLFKILGGSHEHN